MPVKGELIQRIPLEKLKIVFSELVIPLTKISIFGLTIFYQTFLAKKSEKKKLYFFVAPTFGFLSKIVIWG